MSGEDGRVMIWFGPDRYSRRLREQTGRSPFGIAAAKQGHAEETHSVTRTEAPPDVARRLGIRKGTEVVRRDTRYLVDGEPVQYSVTYLSADLADGVPLESDEIYSRLEELGWPVARIREEVTARMPTPAEAESLGVTEQVPVIEVTHTSMDDWKRPFEVTRFLMRADRTGLDYDLPIED